MKIKQLEIELWEVVAAGIGDNSKLAATEYKYLHSD